VTENARRVLELRRDDTSEPLVPDAESLVLDDVPADELVERIFAADVVLVV
jgi:hypothetical protein